MESYVLPHLPPNVRNVHIAYFENVANAPEIRARLVAAATAPGAEGDAARASVDFGFVEASLLVSKQHLVNGVLAAVLTSLPSDRQTTLPVPPTPKTRSHNLHSEILLALSPNNNITDAIRRHGVGDATTRLVVVRYADNTLAQEEIWAMIASVVRGTLTSLDELDNVNKPDWTRIDKLGEMNQQKVGDIMARKIAAVENIVAIKHAT
ncbi:uncharacterized protein EHS24_006206 [Apiotrichum porosum]|uniref:EKC/KEOPS complex subunit CGI121 n=1 Tax=Apiotrichum porosum TaxID=105984 RepID=A0A427Y0V3_9TREE|nr:uncharacterized protein EHS24_006206 [Apiotrichum porosum]RSH84682.1 hypothetical protein EHS24_006206 [Apiotrichum porosum]